MWDPWPLLRHWNPVHQLGIKPGPPARSLGHWNTREGPRRGNLDTEIQGVWVHRKEGHEDTARGQKVKERSLRGKQTCCHLFWTFSLLNCEKSISIVSATQSAVFCYSSLSKLIQWPWRSSHPLEGSVLSLEAGCQHSRLNPAAILWGSPSRPTWRDHI